MAILPDLDLKQLPSKFQDLPPGRYRISLVEVKKLYSKKKEPYLEWLWVVVDGPSHFVGEKLFSTTGTKGPRLSKHLRALYSFRLGHTSDFDVEKLLHRQVTIYVDYSEGISRSTIRMMPAEYYEYSPRWRPNGWILDFPSGNP